MPANNSAHERSRGNDKHYPEKPNASRWEEDNTVGQSTTGQSVPIRQNRRPSVTFDLPPLRHDEPQQHSQQHKKRVSTHSKTSSIGSIGGQSFTPSISSSASCSSSAVVTTLNTGSATSPARRQLRKKQRASTISSVTVPENATSSSSSAMRFGVKLDFNKRSSKRFSQDSLSKELPPLPYEVCDKRVSGQLPLPPFDVIYDTSYSGLPASHIDPRRHEDAVLHIKNNGKRRSSLKNRTDLPPLPNEATQHSHRAVSMLNKAEHLAEVKRQTEIWLSMLRNSGDGDSLFTHSLSPSSSNSSLNGKTTAPSSGCCDPDFLLVEGSMDHSLHVSQLPIPYSSPILRSPFTDTISQPLNPFEESFIAGRHRQSSSEIILPSKRRSSLPTHLLLENSSDTQKRLDKHRPPPLSLVPIQDSPAEEEEVSASQTALPAAPQYRSRSLSHELRPLDPLSLYHRRFHRSSQDNPADLSVSASRSRENSVSSSSAASMIFTSSNDSSIDNSSTGRRFSSATTVSSNMPSPKSPNHPRTPTLQDLLEEGPIKEAGDTVTGKESASKERTYPGIRHGKQSSTSSVEVVMYGVAR